MSRLHMHQRVTVTGLLDARIPLASILDEISAGVVLIDNERRVVFFNRVLEGLTGLDREQVLGIPCAYALRSNICMEGCPWGNMGIGGEPFSVEGNIISRERRKVPVHVTFSPVHDETGRRVGLLETFTDMRASNALHEKLAAPHSFDRLIGHSAPMEHIHRILPVIAQSDSSVLITGETGTGKDLAAQAIHEGSSRASRPFIKVSCGALPETLMESELFGHEKGAFGSALEHKPGCFKLAHNGTIYLTEIGDLPLSLQGKLLTFLDENVIFPLGSGTARRLNVRVITAGRMDLERMVGEGRFREDLLFRLKAVHLHLPPLRERGDDRRLLLDHFARTCSAQLQTSLKDFSHEAMQVLAAYGFPGNVRELKHIVEYAFHICRGDEIQVTDLPAYLADAAGREASPGQTWASEKAPAGTLEESRETNVHWGLVERKMILDALLKTKGRRSQAAELLGWGRSTLWRKMKQHGIDA